LHADLEGQLAIEEAHWLLRAASGRRSIVEIGSYRGKSTVLLAIGCADVEGRVTAIDPHLPAPGARSGAYTPEDERLLRDACARHGVQDRVDHWVMTSREARPHWGAAPIDLLWIDGDHSEAGVRADLDQWSPLVRPGGLLAAHDYTHREGVRAAWDALVRHAPGWGPTGSVRSIVYAERRAPHGSEA